MQIKDFKQMYFAELSELHSAETQLSNALGEMARQASHDGLKQALTAHRDETEAHKARLEDILRGHGTNPRAHQDQSMAALIGEARKMTSILAEPDLRDAGMIASAQKIEHYEIAAYGTAAAYAGMLGLRDEQAVLHRILDEEKAADARLTLLAKQVVNPDAAGRP